MESIASVIPRVLAQVTVTRAHFQTAQHYDAWRAGRPIRTARKHRWKVPAEWRDLIKRSCGYRCRDCGKREYLTIEHVIPVVFGGSNDLCNLTLLCSQCNRNRWTPELAALAKESA
jgi:5-methylcytosine-specific restriction endonuclease McrA